MDKDRAKQAKRKIKWRNKQYVKECKELSSCEVCGEGRASCLVYHHRAGEHKRFELSDAKSHSLAMVHDEIKKCKLLCANCHHILHAEDRLENAVKTDELSLFDNSEAG